MLQAWLTAAIVGLCAGHVLYALLPLPWRQRCAAVLRRGASARLGTSAESKPTGCSCDGCGLRQPAAAATQRVQVVNLLPRRRD